MDRKTMKNTDNIEKILPYVTKASRYLGNEINSVKKDLSKASITFALAFPDTYEVGMSHLGLHILYDVLNKRDEIACERVFAPWPDMEKEMKSNKLLLSSLESGHALNNFDILGFSLEYELSYATVLKMLSLSDIPLLSKDRSDTCPLVIAGGPSTLNPEPVADFFDAMVIGDGEEAVIEISDTVNRWKKKNTGKESLLNDLSEIPGVYIPSFFDVKYNKDKTIKEIIPLKKGYEKIERRIVTNFNEQPFCTSPIVPYMQIIHDRAAIEITRGCSRGCRFCMAGMIYRPVREKSTKKIRELACESLKNTGYEELAFASLSSGDYSDIENLLSLTMQEHQEDKIAVSFPSLRAGTLTDELIDQIKKVRKTGFTIAPEAGTQRLRNVINKGITEQEILDTASKIFSAGWNLVKLYFMIGLPTETTEDLDGIIAISKKVLEAGRKTGRGRIQINVSISTFVPKPHTPFQWEEQDSEETILEKQSYLKKGLRSKKINFKSHDHKLSILESIFSRGDRNLAPVLQKAHELGAGFEAWTEFFDNNIWTEAFEHCNIRKEDYLRKRKVDECLPWAHISARIKRDFLLKEREKAYNEQITPDCRTADCSQCGVCENNIRPELKPQKSTLPKAGAKETSSSNLIDQQETPSFNYTFSFSKTGPARFISHLELSRCFARAMRRAGISMKYSKGFHPLPRIIFHEALSVGIESMGESANLELNNKIASNEIISKVNPHLPEGIIINRVKNIAQKKMGLDDSDKNKKYLIYLQQNNDAAGKIKDFLSKEDLIITLVSKKKSYNIDIKEAVAKITIDENNILEIITRNTQKKSPKITKIIETILQIDEKETAALQIIKTTT
jgi:radical SAM family uncharacterized protein/radical SAM-linked protein